MSYHLDNFGQSIIDLVVDSEDFGNAVSETVKEEIGEAIENAIAEENIDQQIEKAVEILGDEFEKRITKLEETIHDQNIIIGRLMAETEELSNRINSVSLSVSDLSRYQSRMRTTLSTIPLLRRWFKW